MLIALSKRYLLVSIAPSAKLRRAFGNAIAYERPITQMLLILFHIGRIAQIIPYAI
ncbi:hypothetical protein [Nostoc sp. NZL]|uniref:hypothetical protein n=1 Tax=Nostoc sp. NZL TaxID=2650612 RepID=UPI001E3DA5D5|nr:hypothetical protein [Nostoc sp. NZL]